MIRVIERKLKLTPFLPENEFLKLGTLWDILVFELFYENVSWMLGWMSSDDSHVAMN